MRAFLSVVVLLVIAASGLALLAQGPGRTVSLVMVNGTVVTMDGAVVTEGATFNVGKLLERSVVSVSRGSALLRPQLGRPVRVSEGETFYFNGKGAQQTEMPFGVVSAWTRGVCVADRMPLAENPPVRAPCAGLLVPLESSPSCT